MSESELIKPEKMVQITDNALKALLYKREIIIILNSDFDISNIKKEDFLYVETFYDKKIVQIKNIGKNNNGINYFKNKHLDGVLNNDIPLSINLKIPEQIINIIHVSIID